MNDSDYWAAVAKAHDVTCPICGRKASYTPTGRASYTFLGCHDELSELVDRRLEALLSPADKPRYVKMKLAPPSSQKK